MTMEHLSLPEIGDQIGGRFRILEVLGTGGFGTVYKALQENIGRDVALKFLTPIVAKDPINVERFRREAYHVSQLRHPNTITLYDYGQTEEGLAYMVMEYLEGVALGDSIQNDGPLELSRAAHVYIQVLKSLSEAHRRGLVHRDLKPENIFLCEMFGEQDYVKVLDFGVAKMTMADSDDEEGGETLTRAGRIFGTPMYMAPEQACAEPITPATDVYALGLLLFEITTGHPPVTGRNRIDVIHKQIRDPVPILTPELEGTPLGRLIRRACEKDPQLRFQDAAALLDGFYRAMQEMSVHPAPLGASRPDIAVSYIGPQEVAVPIEAHPTSAVAERTVAERTVADRPTGENALSTNAPNSPIDVSRSLSAPGNPAGGPPPLPTTTPKVNKAVPSQQASQASDLGDRPRQPPQDERTHSRPRYELPLVGRDEEFNTFFGLIRGASETSTGHFILLEGESGLGKSHLVASTLRKLGDDLTIAMAHFRRRSSPMEALRDLIAGIWGVSHAERMQVDKIVRHDLRTLGDFSEEEINVFIEFLRPRTAEGTEIVAKEAGTLYARLERLLLRLCERRPLVLVVEDLQYADSASLAFLEYFAVTLRTHAVPVVVIMTLRPEERGLNPDLEHSLLTISANVGVGFSRLRLRRLKGRDLAVLLDAIVPLEARLKERIGWLCQGVPLHAIQIIRYLQNEGNLVRQGKRFSLRSGLPRKINLPPDLMELMVLRVEQAVQKRKERPDLQLILQWLAILGMRTPVELLAMVLHQAEKRNTDTLDQDLIALTEEGIVRQALHQNLICVEFDNSLIREALLVELKEQWSKARLHRIAAEQKVSFYRGRQMEIPLVEIADHWRQAAESERYRDTLMSAARRSMTRFDLRGARDQYRELVGLLDERKEKSDLWTEAHMALAELARRFGEFGLAEDHYRRIIDQGVARGRERSRALRGFGHLLAIQVRYKEATHYFSQALDWSHQIKDASGVAKALVGLSHVHLMQSDPRAGELVRKRLEDMLPNLQEQEVIGKVNLHLAEAALRRGNLTGRYDYLIRARRAYAQSQDHQGLSDSLIALGGALMSPAMNAPGRLLEAGQVLREALELKRSIGDRHGVAEAFRALGQLEMEIGNYEASENLLKQSLNIHQVLGAPFYIGATHNAIGVLFLILRKYRRAEEHFDRAIDLFQRMGDQIAISQPMLNKGITAINLRNINQAQTYLREARRIKESLGSNWALFDLRNNLAIVALWLGEFEAADKLLEETLEHVDTHGTGEDRALARSLMGLLRCFQSRLQMAALELGRARADAEDLNIERVTVFCQANAAFYAHLTGSQATYEGLIQNVENIEVLHALDRDVWLELLENMAMHTIQQERSRQALRLLRTVIVLWARFGQQGRADVLTTQANELEAELNAVRS